MNAPARPTSAGEDILTSVVGLVASYRVELTTVVLAPGVVGFAWHHFRFPLPVYGWVPVVLGYVSVALFLVIPWVRRKVAHSWLRASWRRKLRRALTALDVPHLRGRYLTVLRVTRTPAGHLLLARVPSGASWEDLDTNAERLAAALRVHKVAVKRENTDAGRVTIGTVR